MANVEDYAAFALQLVAPCAAQPLRVQLWNELNHLPSHWIRSGACELLSALGRGARRANATAQLWVNAMADDPLWHRAVDGWIDCAGGYIDAVGVDHYPGTWTLSSWTDWAPLDRLLDATATSWAGRAAGVLETGYSSWSSIVASEDMQASWVNASLPAMRERVRAAGAASRFEVANWYTLLDGVHLAHRLLAHRPQHQPHRKPPRRRSRPWTARWCGSGSRAVYSRRVYNTSAACKRGRSTCGPLH